MHEALSHAGGMRGGVAQPGVAVLKSAGMSDDTHTRCRALHEPPAGYDPVLAAADRCIAKCDQIIELLLETLADQDEPGHNSTS